MIGAHRWLVPLSLRARLFLLLAPLLLTGRAMFSGGVFAPLDITYQAPPLAHVRAAMGVGTSKTPILGDVVYQEIPWRKAVRESIKHARVPAWNRFVLAGEPLLAMQQPAILHPFTWIGMLLPLAQAWTLEMTLGILLALLAAYVLLRDLGLCEAACALGAVGWAFSDYLVFWAGYPLAPAAAPFPLLLLGLRRLARNPGASAVGITAAALWLIGAAGHSETLLHAVAGGGVWFLGCLIGVRRPGRAVLFSVLAGVIASGLLTVVLLPHLEALPHTMEYFFRSAWYAHVSKSTTLPLSILKLQQLVVPYSFGASGHGEGTPGQMGISTGYVGAALFPFALVGLTVRRRVTLAFAVLGLLGAGMWAGVPVLTDAVSRLPLFDIAINDRLIFLACFSGAGLAALGLDELARDRGRRFFDVAVVAALVGLGVAVFLLRPRLLALHMPAGYLWTVALLQLVPLALLAGICVLAGRKRLLLPGVLAVVLLARVAEASLIYPVIPSRAFYPPLAFLDPIPRNAPWRITAVGFTFIPNIAALYELEDVRGYEAMTFRPLFETYPLWSVHQPVWFNRVDDPTRPFLSFLNVRYVITGPDYVGPLGWREVSASPEGRVLENPHALPRAFAPASVSVAPDQTAGLTALATITDFSREGVVEQLPGHVPGTRFANGPAAVGVTSYAPGRLTLQVNAVAPAVIGTSITAWPGWEILIDGVAGAAFTYNHAFLGCRVPAGSHEVRFRYAPKSLRVGALISIVTAAGLLAWAWRSRVRRELLRAPGAG